MTKQAFLTELAERLSVLEEPLRNEICGDFADHFNAGAEQGLSEEAICQNLGQPAAIAEQFIDEYADALKSKHTLPSTPEITTIPQITDIIQGVVKSFTSGTSLMPINLCKSFDNAAQVRVELKSSHVTLQRNEQSHTFTVSIQGEARHDRFAVECVNGELQVIENAVKYPFSFFFSQKVLLETVISIPASFKGTVLVQLSNGEALAVGIGGESLQLKNAAGNVRIEKCRFSHFNISAFAGSLRFLESHGERISLHASAGSLWVENTSGILEAHCSAGNLHARQHTGEYMKADSSAGDVFIQDCAAEIDAHSAAGNVKILCGGKALHRVKVHSAAGDIRLEAAESRTVEMSSAAGSAKVKVDSIKGDIRLSSGAGNIRLEAREVSGNIEARASAGSIWMRLPDPVNCRIEASSRMGKVKQNINGTAQSPYVLRATASMGTVTLAPME